MTPHLLWLLATYVQNLFQTTFQDSFLTMRSILPVPVATNTLMMLMIQKSSPKQLLTLALNTKFLRTHHLILASQLTQTIIRTSPYVSPWPYLLLPCLKTCPSSFLRLLLNPHSFSHQAHHQASLLLQEQQPLVLFRTSHHRGNLRFDAESWKVDLLIDWIILHFSNRTAPQATL